MAKSRKGPVGSQAKEIAVLASHKLADQSLGHPIVCHHTGLGAREAVGGEDVQLS